MITQKQLCELTQFNGIISNNEYFKAATCTDNTVRNKYNMHQCMCAIELYSYMYKHYDIICEVLRIDACEEVNIYLTCNIINHLLYSMSNRQLSAKQAIDDLKRIRKAADYSGELG